MAKVIRLGFDVDGVLCRFVEGFNLLLNTIRPNAIPYGYEPLSWSGWVEERLVTKEEYGEAWRRLKTDSRFWMKLNPHEENTNTLARFLEIRSQSIETYFITSRMATGFPSMTAQHQTALWLQYHLSAWDGIGGKRSCVIPVEHSRDKVAVATSLRLTAFIEDNLETFYDMRCAGINAYLLDRPWNSRPTGYEEYRVRTLAEFLDREGNDKDSSSIS